MGRVSGFLTDTVCVRRGTVAVILLSFMSVVLVAAIAVSNAIEDGEDRVRAGCVRANGLRMVLNEQHASIDSLNDVVDHFLRSAREGRLATGKAADRKVADEYGQDILKVAVIPSVQVPLTDCDWAQEDPNQYAKIYKAELERARAFEKARVLFDLQEAKAYVRATDG